MLYAHWVKKEMGRTEAGLVQISRVKGTNTYIVHKVYELPPQRKTYFLLYEGSIKLTFFSPYLKLLIFHISFSCLPQPFLLPYTNLIEGPGNKMVYEAVARHTALSISLVRKKKAEIEPKDFYIPSTIYGEQTLKCTLWLLRWYYPDLSKLLSYKGLSLENMSHFYNR